MFLTAEIQTLKPVFDKLAIKYSDIQFDKLLDEVKNKEKLLRLLNKSEISDREDKWAVFDVFKVFKETTLIDKL